MKLKKITYAIYVKLRHKKEKFITVELNGKKLRIVKATVINVKFDTDDFWFNSLAQNSNILYDIGCNVGKTVLIALTNDNMKQVVLVDTNPEALGLGNMNLIQNNYVHKTNSFLGFVSDKIDEEIDFFTIGHGAAGSMFRSHAETASVLGMSYKVNTVTLDSLVNFFNATPDFIKIDVEGAESFVLNGVKETAKSNSIKILVEMHSNKELTMTENTDKILKWSDEVGYSAWYLTDKLRLVNSETVKHRGRFHFLLIPRTDHFPLYL